MHSFKMLYPTPSENRTFLHASMHAHRAAARIVRWASADFLDPWALTADDLKQYADERDSTEVLELARIKYRLQQYEEFYVSHMDAMQDYRYN